ncbi:hypothetical protein [Plantactinospora endophytica]|uniref:Uncharacterized protein n=1 Tax=Plantactinospora endophytica TaxID=673535 RepID=A0ABQ4EF14_9ACTN|nr:hypothetical protein [Plantactinospora endophytica]GIG93259.1 hypothetical protein Pen02_81950 [Plantactinospora endophytica]
MSSKTVPLGENLDADMFFQLADAVRYCVTRRNDIASHFQLPDIPLTIILGLTDDPAPIQAADTACGSPARRSAPH